MHFAMNRISPTRVCEVMLAEEWLHERGSQKAFVPLARPLLPDVDLSPSALDSPRSDEPQAALCTLLMDWRALTALLVVATTALAVQETRELCVAGGAWIECVGAPVLSAIAMLCVCIAACSTSLEGGDRLASHLFCGAIVVAPCYQVATVRAGPVWPHLYSPARRRAPQLPVFFWSCPWPMAFPSSGIPNAGAWWGRGVRAGAARAAAAHRTGQHTGACASHARFLAG